MKTVSKALCFLVFIVCLCVAHKLQVAQFLVGLAERPSANAYPNRYDIQQFVFFCYPELDSDRAPKALCLYVQNNNNNGNNY